MIIEISVGVIAIAFVILVIFLIIALCRLIHLIKNANDLALDIKEKSEAVNGLFRPLLRKKKPERKYEKIAEIINFATDGIVLFNRLIKKHR